MSTDDLDAFLAEKSTDPAFTQHWEALQATIRPATTDQQPAVYGATQPARLVITETAPIGLRLKAARHETRCHECRVTWRSWAQRLLGMSRGYSPRPRKASQ